jgi:hypothetical protein
LTYETDLQAKANILALKDAMDYRITATKSNYRPWVRNYPRSRMSKVEILFEQNAIPTDKQLPIRISFKDKRAPGQTSERTYDFVYDLQRRPLKVTNSVQIPGSHNYLFVTDLTYGYPTLIPSTQHWYNVNTPGVSRSINALQIAGEVIAVQYREYPNHYLNIATFKNDEGLITQARAYRQNPNDGQMVYHFYYDLHKNLVKTEVFLDGNGAHDGVDKIYEQTFDYDEHENAIPLPLLNSWVRDVFSIGVYSTYDFMIIPFLIQKPHNAIVRSTYTMFSSQIPGRVTYSQRCQFNYVYQAGRPVALTVFDETLQVNVRTDFSFTY